MRGFVPALAACLPYTPLLAAAAQVDRAVPSRRELGDIAERCGLPRYAITLTRDGGVRIQSRRGLRPEQVRCAQAELRNRGLYNGPLLGGG